MMGGMAAAAIAIAIGILIVLVIFVLILLVDVFIINPLEVGCRRFFIRNLNEPAQIGNIGYGFDNNYRNVAKTMFFRDLFTVLWSLLFVIPGKMYHPIKDRSKTNAFHFCPCIIRLLSANACSLVICGLSARRYGIIIYSYAFTIPGMTAVMTVMMVHCAILRLGLKKALRTD